MSERTDNTRMVIMNVRSWSSTDDNLWVKIEFLLDRDSNEPRLLKIDGREYVCARKDASL